MPARHDKILARMRATKAGWRPQDFQALYLGHGFVQTELKKHTQYQHPRHLELWTTVARGVPLSKAYAEEAVKLIDKLNRMEGT